MATDNQLMIRLLQLPKKAQKHVCRLMDPLRQLTLSTCHQATKNLVKSSGLKCEQYHVSGEIIILKFNDPCKAVLDFLDDDDESPGFKSVRAGHTMLANEYENLNYHWTIPLFTVRDWIEHTLSVLNRNNIDYLCCYPDIFGFYLQLVGFNIDSLDISYRPAEETLQLIYGFPRMKHLELQSILPEIDFQKVLMQNFISLKSAPEQKLYVNTLLLCNCVYFECYNNNLTPKDLNKFIKLWQKGSNQRMKSIQVRFKSQDQMVSKEIVLRGTNHQDQTDDRSFIYFSYLTKVFEEIILRGGYEINRKDGTRATLMIGRAHFEMYVWT